MSALSIDYYSDLLCVWAWIAQVRNDELQQHFGEKISLAPHWMNLFGDTQTRIGKGWQDKGGFAGFAEHVQESVANYEHAPVHQDVWRKVQPLSSAPAHLWLSIIAKLHNEQTALKFSKRLREAFFVEALDISHQGVLTELAQDFALDATAIRETIYTGGGFAPLMQDYQQVEKLKLQGSPTWLLNGGRQTLFGNVGFRVLQANIEELLRQPEGQASWC